MRNEEFEKLSMKPELSPDDEARLEAYLAAHPEQRLLWQEERALGRAIQSLPDVPVSNNFTARVLEQLDLEERRAERSQRATTSWWRQLFPRFGWAVAALALAAVLSLQQFKAAKRTQLAHDAAFVTTIATPEILRDFDAIDSMRGMPPSSDAELLIALQ